MLSFWLELLRGQVGAKLSSTLFKGIWRPSKRATGWEGTGPGGTGTPREKARRVSVENLPPNFYILMKFGANRIAGDAYDESVGFTVACFTGRLFLAFEKAERCCVNSIAASWSVMPFVWQTLPCCAVYYLTFLVFFWIVTEGLLMLLI